MSEAALEAVEQFFDGLRLIPGGQIIGIQFELHASILSRCRRSGTLRAGAQQLFFVHSAARFYIVGTPL
jgi:hypothetical protein